MADNVNKVSKKQWKKWSPRAQEVFNDLFEMMFDNQELFVHPNFGNVIKEHWKTTCWNAAWMAADFSDGR